MTLSLRAMRYVQAALHHGSITGAAEATHVTPSAIASALDQAETAFDDGHVANVVSGIISILGWRASA